jgi:hypothetical protein
MKQFIEAKATKVEEKKDPETGTITYRVELEVVDKLTVNSLVKPELNKSQLFEVSHYDFTDEKGKRIKGFKILGTAK